MILRETVMYTHRPYRHHASGWDSKAMQLHPGTLHNGLHLLVHSLHGAGSARKILGSLHITYNLWPTHCHSKSSKGCGKPKKKLIYQFIHYTLLITISDCHIWSYQISRLHRPHALPGTSWPLAHNCSSANRRSVVFHHGLRLKTPCQASWQRRMNEGWKWKQWCRERS